MKGNDIRRWKRYPEYKDSGIEWVQQIPSHWRVERLKHLASVRVSNVDKKSVEGQQAIRLCNYLDVYRNECITADMEFMEATATDDQIRTFAVRKGDVIITKDSENWDDIAVPAFVDDDLQGVVCGYHLAHIRPKPGLVNGEFLARCFSARGISEQFKVAANGVTRFGLSTGSIETSLFPVPPVREQDQIVRVVHRRTGKIDALIAKKERLIELLQEKRAALISQAITKGLDPKVPMKDSGVDWLGRIPAHWRVKRVKHLVRAVGGIRMGPFGGMLKDLQSEPTPYKLYGQENTINNDFTAGRRWLSKSHFSQLREYELHPGDVVLTRKGASIGNCRIVPLGIERGVIDSDTIRVRVNELIDVDFMVLLMHEGYLESEISAKQKGSVLPGLNTGTIANLRVAVPPAHEQQAILAHVDKQRNRLDSLTSRMRQAIDRLREYRTALISAAVTGKIDVRDEV